MNLVPATESKAKKKIQTLQRVLKTGYSGKYDILNTIFYIRPPKIFYFRPKNRDFIFEEFFFSFVPFIKIKLLLISFMIKRKANTQNISIQNLERIQKENKQNFDIQSNNFKMVTEANQRMQTESKVLMEDNKNLLRKLQKVSEELNL